MRKIITSLLLLSVAFALMRTPPVHGQAGLPQIALLDRDAYTVTSIVDGNQVRLRIRLDADVSGEARVAFTTQNVDGPLAECVIQTGSDSCDTPPFPALGWYWNPDGSAQPQRTIHASVNGIQVPGSLTVNVIPRPVVMVHGFNSDFTAWTNYLGPNGYLMELGLQGFAVGDGQVPGVMDTGSLSDPFKRTNSIAQNAVILGEYIENVQEATGAEKVDLLVHSMGGMISRYYLDRVMTNDNVAQLIILGTPMAGSACSILPASLGMMLPATLEIQPGYMVNVFNQQIVKRKGVPFYALAGTKLLDAVASPCTPVPSDVVVTLDSVRAIPMPVEEIPLLHIELNTSREAFDGFVTRHLKTPPGGFETAVDPPPGSSLPASQQFSRVYTGHVDPGETQDVVINIDPNVTVANFALFDTSRSLAVSVTGASGNRLELDPIANGIIRIDDPSTMVYLGYGFRQPRPGRWIVTLETTEATPASGADFAIAAQFNGGALLQTTQDFTVTRVNQTVAITGSLTAEGAPIPLTGAEAVVRAPDGSAETLTMTINGNRAEVEVTPRMSGIHGVEVNVLAQTADGHLIDRAAFLTFDAEPTWLETSRNQLAVAAMILGAVVGIVALTRRRRKNRRVRAQRNPLSQEHHD
jgi:pimeloyl-ACP methyl ester carboxylesterase